MKPKKRRPKPTLGSVIAIPLPGGKYAFAKVYRDQDLGVYDLVSDKIEPLVVVTRHNIAFYQGCTDAPIVSGEWAVIGVESFPSEDAAWAPPRASGIFPGMPIIPETLQISFKGSQRHATLKDVAGLDIATLSIESESFIDEVVDRLVNHNYAKYQIPK